MSTHSVDPPADSISFVPLTSWVRAASRCGFALAPVLRDAGIRVDDAATSGMTLSFDQSKRLINACVDRAQNDHFPFVLGECFAFGALPELEAFISTCSTLREALQIYDWVGRLMSPALRVTLREASDLAYLEVAVSFKAARQVAWVYFTETTMTGVLKLVRSLLGSELPVERLFFKHPSPSYATAYANFLGARAEFGQACNAIVLRRELLDRVLPGELDPLHRDAEKRIRIRLAEFAPQQSLPQRVERQFREHPALLTGGVEESAAALGLHVRALQRRLRSDGLNFADLQARARYRAACTLLRDTNLSLEEISELLGFSDRRAFTRAFCRWSGVSPSSFRRTPGNTKTPS